MSTSHNPHSYRLLYAESQFQHRNKVDHFPSFRRLALSVVLLCNHISSTTLMIRAITNIQRVWVGHLLYLQASSSSAQIPFHHLTVNVAQRRTLLTFGAVIAALSCAVCPSINETACCFSPLMPQKGMG